MLSKLDEFGVQPSDVAELGGTELGQVCLGVYQYVAEQNEYNFLVWGCP